jgi:hypothetical protein
MTLSSVLCPRKNQTKKENGADLERVPAGRPEGAGRKKFVFPLIERTGNLRYPNGKREHLGWWTCWFQITLGTKGLRHEDNHPSSTRVAMGSAPSWV